MKIVIVTLLFLIRSPLASSHTDNFQISSFCLVNKTDLPLFTENQMTNFTSVLAILTQFVFVLTQFVFVVCILRKIYLRNMHKMLQLK